jgi:threonine dehydrogenase-like Zn-dependent dehydrogenase
MKALVWHGTKHVQVDDVPEPTIVNSTDVILEITCTAICGSDLHLFDGFVPTMEKGDILGHEFAGVVVAKGDAVTRLKVGDRVIVPFVIACGECEFCRQGLTAACERSNPQGSKQKVLSGYPTAGLFGYSHTYGGFPGGQAEFVRVPYADVSCLVLPEGVSEYHALFLSDIYPTGFMAAENCQIKKGDTVAVWGCGPVGQFAIKSAFMLGAKNVIAIDRVPERLAMAEQSGAITINYEKEDVDERIPALTDNKGPHSCIDAVGMEAHGHSADALFDKVMQTIKMEFDRTHALRQMIRLCRNGGTVSMPGVYVGFVDRYPLGIAFAKGLTFKMGQTHVQRYLEPLLKTITDNQIDPRFIVSHNIPLIEAASAYQTFAEKRDCATKFVLHPKGVPASVA